MDHTSWALCKDCYQCERCSFTAWVSATHSPGRCTASSHHGLGGEHCLWCQCDRDHLGWWPLQTPHCLCCYRYSKVLIVSLGFWEKEIGILKENPIPNIVLTPYANVFIFIFNLLVLYIYIYYKLINICCKVIFNICIYCRITKANQIMYQSCHLPFVMRIFKI